MFGNFKDFINILKWENEKVNRRKKKYTLDSNGEKLKKIKKAIIFQVPTHGNIGDQAITEAEKIFLTSYLPDYHIVEIAASELLAKYTYVKEILNEKDILFLHGGGNLGTIYLKEEMMRRFVIENFKSNPLILFPQSASFDRGAFGKSQLKKSKKVYMSNPNLTLVARESRTLEIIKKAFPGVNTLYTPDIVLFLDETDKEMKRQGITTFFRKDSEAFIDQNFKETLVENLKTNYTTVKISDTHLGPHNDIREKNRYEILSNKWNEIKSSELVITDRLHGMIFCAITQTPCIVFKNSNHKIEYSYKDWLFRHNYIYLVENENNITWIEMQNKIDYLLNVSPNKVNLMKEFSPLIEHIKESSKL